MPYLTVQTKSRIGELTMAQIARLAPFPWPKPWMGFEELVPENDCKESPYAVQIKCCNGWMVPNITWIAARGTSNHSAAKAANPCTI